MMDKIPTPTRESRAIAAELDRAAAEYAAILGENYRARKAECFEKCRALAERLYSEGKITLFAGDCGFGGFYTAISTESGHFTAVAVFCADSENFYMMGVCRGSTPLFRRVDTEKDDITAFAENRWGKRGVYFER